MLLGLGDADKRSGAITEARASFQKATALGRTLLPLLVSLAEWAMAHRDEINANRTSLKA